MDILFVRIIHFLGPDYILMASKSSQPSHTTIDEDVVELEETENVAILRKLLINQ